MTEKTPNYTPEMTAEIKAAYVAAQTDEERAAVVKNMAKKHGKTPASVRAKLVREEVYVAKTYKTKQGNAPVSKAALVERIAKAMGVQSEAVESLEKATKATLKAVLAAVTPAEVETETNESE